MPIAAGDASQKQAGEGTCLFHRRLLPTTGVLSVSLRLPALPSRKDEFFGNLHADKLRIAKKPPQSGIRPILSALREEGAGCGEYEISQ